ncbi:ABC transporter permease [Sediminivirga luteola]|uniref:Transport permease protein n=1 Tax=Sediminivirga luteola TaxID=1774748 RepID=A0A8J2TYK1_9MICO|nr:ABC transporter permease [Sediminivirga luteola]MCI2264814.1 ABC transporter permease [Sediminivirga luteola]GGA16256.1 transport permease protein [Sediminivirga luteola]
MSTTTPAAPATEAQRIAQVLVAPGERPKRSGPVSASLTYGWRALLKIKHIPEQLFDVTIFPIMMTVMMTYVFGGSIGAAVSGTEAGGDAVGAYVQWLIPGVFAQTLVMITMYTGLTLNRDISKGVFDRFRSLPTWRPAQLVGALLGDQVRYMIAGVIILVVGFVMGFRPEGGLNGVLAAFLLLLVFSFCLSWVWTTVALLMRTEQAAMGVSMFIMMPLTFVSNIFAPTETMPGPVRAFAEVNPVSTVVAAIRELMNGVYDPASLLMVLIYCAVLVVIFGPVSMVIYNRKS